jgi:hypothetical protein
MNESHLVNRVVSDAEIEALEKVLTDRDLDETHDIADIIVSFWDARPCVTDTGRAIIPDSHYGPLKDAITWALRKERSTSRK